MGVEVYKYADQELVIGDMCKSPACSSCGIKANMEWRRQRLAALPNTKLKGLTFSMPRALWTIFKNNAGLTRFLPSLAATAIQTHLMLRHGLKCGVIAILQTFDGKMEFNPHIHAIATAGGLYATGSAWYASAYFMDLPLRKSWKRLVMQLLREYFRKGTLTLVQADEFEITLAACQEPLWHVHIQNFRSARHFFAYAGRYVRRPPISQRRITYVGQEIVRFEYQDKKRKEVLEVQYSISRFLDLWVQHILDPAQHCLGNYGLYSSRVVGYMGPLICSMLGQTPMPHPKPLTRSERSLASFAIDPLQLPNGHRMKWVERIPAKDVSQLLRRSGL